MPTASVTARCGGLVRPHSQKHHDMTARKIPAPRLAKERSLLVLVRSLTRHCWLSRSDGKRQFVVSFRSVRSHRLIAWRARASGQERGGTKRHNRCMRPLGACRMQACMRLSLDSRRGKSPGTTTVPRAVVITIAARPLLLAGASISALSTGAQSIQWQHSKGYQS